MERMTKITKCDKQVQDLYLITDAGRVFSLQSNKFIKWIDNGNGYYAVSLRANHYKKKYFIHRLVAMHFIPNPENKPFINHKDCNPKNNNASNLEWCSPKENIEYASKLGRMTKTKEWTEKIRDGSHKKTVLCLNTITGEEKEYPSIQSTVKDGFQPSCVCQCCEGIRQMHRKCYWRYKDE